MSNLAIGLLSALVATNQPAVVSNLIVQNTGISLNIPNPNDPGEKAYQELLVEDNAAQGEVDKWIRDNQAFVDKGGGTPREILSQRIRDRFASVRKAYEDFLEKHPDHARARLAYGSFLMDINDEEGGVKQMERSLQLDPKNPAAWNNLANHYGHDGPVKKSFEYYTKAIELNPFEPVYYQNLATTVYLFRHDAMEFYNSTEQQVFDKALAIYKKALKLDPDDFPLATDLAQSYYGIKPTRTDEALDAWTNALKIAHDDIEREGVYLHFARFKLNAERFEEARQHLASVTNQMYTDLKNRLIKNLNEREKRAKETNAPATHETKQ